MVLLPRTASGREAYLPVPNGAIAPTNSDYLSSPWQSDDIIRSALRNHCVFLTKFLLSFFRSRMPVRLLSSPAVTRLPVSPGDGGGPGLVCGAEELSGKGIKVLLETAR